MWLQGGGDLRGSREPEYKRHGNDFRFIPSDMGSHHRVLSRGGTRSNLNYKRNILDAACRIDQGWARRGGRETRLCSSLFRDDGSPDYCGHGGNSRKWDGIWIFSKEKPTWSTGGLHVHAVLEKDKSQR